MNASWMLGATIVTILFAFAAMLLEPVAALYRRMPLRAVWIAAAVGAVALSALRLMPVRTAMVVPLSDALAGNGSSGPTLTPAPAMPAPSVRAASLSTELSKVELPAVAPSADRVVGIMWAGASALLGLLFLSAAWRLGGERLEWTRTRMFGTNLLLSRDFGPAIVGVLRPEIVVPQWITALDEDSRRAIIAHEAEHLRARDPALMLAGLVLIVAMPWNIGLWFCWRGLRRTIELDCDARVLASGIQRGEYANVLLGAWQRARSSWLPSPAFAERASGIGKRVEHLMRPVPRRRAMRTVIGSAAAAVLVFVACATPSEGQRTSATAPYPLVIIDGVKHPELPPRFRFTGAVVPETTTTPFRITYRGPMAIDSAADKLYPREDDIALRQTIAAPASVAHFGPDAQYGASLYYTKKYRAAGGAILFPAEGGEMARRADPNTPADVMSQRIFDNMFAGITMTPAQKSAAMPIIQKAQTEQTAITTGPILVIWPRRMKILDERDASLRSLLTNDKDRAQFDTRAAEGRHGSVNAQSVTDGMYTNLFKYTALTMSSKTEAEAHSIILGALNDEVALFNRAPSDVAGRIAIRKKRDAALRALLTSDADRAKFDTQAERTMKGELPSP